MAGIPPPAPIAAAPAWFIPAVNAVLEPALNQLEARVKAHANKHANVHRDDGTVAPYLVIAFNNGDDPTLPPHNLPPLLNAAVINSIQPGVLTAYLTGYGVDIAALAGANPVATNLAQKRALKQCIGVPLAP